jgi:putative IMPACT (imprinted ancient) family translation regulator
MTVLLHSEIGEIVAVVTRYFGGTKLGTGGLVRAYSGSVKNALAGLSIKEKRDVITLTAILDYSKIAAVKQMIESFNSKIIEAKYEADVSFKIELPKNDKDRFLHVIRDLTGGEVLFTK